MEDYPRLVSAADLGVSLHTSSSGLDLPMKAVDMLGCGVPVCSANYDCIEELVRDGENGRLFRDARELADQFKELFSGFPHGCAGLRALTRGALRSSERRWTDEWASAGLPHFSAPKKEA